MALLILDKINKSFKQGREEFKVLTDLSFQLNEGEIVSLVGPSGSGKSTFLLLAGLLENVDSGIITFDNKDYSKANDLARTNLRRDNIGFIYQFHHLLPEFTALENVMLPKMLQEAEITSVRHDAIELLEQLGLKDRVNSLPSELSGGEQQRVAVARSLINKPKLILADEPTGNLDPHNSTKVIQMLIDQTRERGVAVIIVTHNLALAKKTDKIFTLEDGKILEFND